MRVRKIDRYDGGEKRKSSKFYGVFSDHAGITRRMPLFEDRKASEEAGRKIDKLVDLRAANDTIPEELHRFIETTLPSIRNTLAEWGIIGTAKLAASKPLEEHVKQWGVAILARGKTQRHADLVKGRVLTAFKACGFRFWGDISASKLQAYLHERRQDIEQQRDMSAPESEPRQVKRGISAQTYNFYLQGCKQFCKWMVRDGRANQSPIEHLQGIGVKTDRRHDRRAFSVEEFRQLLTTVKKGASRMKMTGEERVLLYRLAVETGFRRGELASLTRASFDLESDEPSVTVTAASAKARKARSIPLASALVAELKTHLEHKLPDAPAFNVPPRYDTAEMMRGDLQDARDKWLETFKNPKERAEREKSNFLRYEDDQGRHLDFHALRHTRGVWLFEHYKAHPREVQYLMGVSSLILVDRYTQSFRLTDTSLTERGPDLTIAQEPQQLRPTGTEGRTGT